MEGKRVLITGITGFVGSHLADLLLKKGGMEVYGLKRWRSSKENIRHILNDIKLIDGDLRDLKSMNTVISMVQPHKIFHLAAQSFVPTSYDAPIDTIYTNSIGTVNLLEAVRDGGTDPIIHVCSTSEVYGMVPEDKQPINEDTPFAPQNPYGLSKAFEDLTAYHYYKCYGMKTIITRAFSHTGPRRSDVFAASSFAKQIAEIEAGKREPIVKVGNLQSVRTWMDVRDTVEAYWLLSEKGKPGDAYVVGGKSTKSIDEVLKLLISMSTKKDNIKIVQDYSLFRQADITLQIPDCTKLKRATGWEPKIPLETTLRDLLDYWRKKTANDTSF